MRHTRATPTRPSSWCAVQVDEHGMGGVAGAIASDIHAAWELGGFQVTGTRIRKAVAPDQPCIPPTPPTAPPIPTPHLPLAHRATASCTWDGSATLGQGPRPLDQTHDVGVAEPLRQLFPGNAGLHRRAAAERSAAAKRAAGGSTGERAGDDPFSAVIIGVGVRGGEDAEAPHTDTAWADETGRWFQQHHHHQQHSSADRDAYPATATTTTAYTAHTWAPTPAPPMTPVSAETARLARRRHRKRLAQIVVGQWKWFASDALAVLPGSMHHDWRSKRRTMRGWAELVRDLKQGGARRALRLWRQRTQVGARCRGGGGGSDGGGSKNRKDRSGGGGRGGIDGSGGDGDDEWSPGVLTTLRARLLRDAAAAMRAYAMARAKKRRALLHAVIYRRLNVTLRALHRWSQAAAASARVRRLHRAAASHHAKRRVAGVLPAWLAEVWHARRRRLQQARAVGSHQHRALRRTVAGWAHATEGARVRGQLAAAFATAREDVVTRAVWSGWAAEARGRRSARAVASARATTTATKRARRDAADALTHWRGYATVRLQKKVALGAAILVRRRFLRAGVFHGWTLRARWLAATRSKGAQLVAKTRTRVTRHAVHVWAAAAAAAAAIRAAARQVECEAVATAHATASLARAAVRAWAASARSALTAALVAEVKGARMRGTALAHALRTWRLRAAEGGAGRAALERAEDHHDLRLGRAALTQWSAAVADLTAEKEADEVAFEQYARTLLGRVVCAWAAGAASARRAKVAAVWWRHSCMRRTVRRWRHRAQRSAMKEARRRLAVRHSYRRRTRDAVVAWRAHVRGRRVRRLRLDAALDHFGRVAAWTALSVWRGPFLAQVRADRDNAARALDMRRAHLTARAIISWAHRTRVKHERRRRGAGADAHAGAVSLQRAVRAWCAHLEAKAGRREARGARVAAAAAALGRLTRGRAWYAWLEVARELAVLRLQGERADAHFDERMASLAIAGLWREVERRRHKERAAAVADAARRRHYAFGALESWVRYVVGRRRKGRQRAALSRHRRRALATRAFAAWRVWLEGHGARRARLEGALEVHRTRLLREGATVWLREGLRRQEVRQVAAGEAHAAAAAAALLRVEKYARRWRHKALGARQQRRWVAGAVGYSCRLLPATVFPPYHAPPPPHWLQSGLGQVQGQSRHLGQHHGPDQGQLQGHANGHRQSHQGVAAAGGAAASVPVSGVSCGGSTRADWAMAAAGFGPRTRPPARRGALDEENRASSSAAATIVSASAFTSTPTAGAAGGAATGCVPSPAGSSLPPPPPPMVPRSAVEGTDRTAHVSLASSAASAAAAEAEANGGGYRPLNPAARAFVSSSPPKQQQKKQQQRHQQHRGDGTSSSTPASASASVSASTTWPLPPVGSMTPRSIVSENRQTTNSHAGAMSTPLTLFTTVSVPALAIGSTASTSPAWTLTPPVAPLTPAQLQEYETVIAEYEALRAETARLTKEAASFSLGGGTGDPDSGANAGGGDAAAAARGRVLAAAAAHLRQRRRDLLPAVRAAAAALGEARDDLASVVSTVVLPRR